MPGKPSSSAVLAEEEAAQRRGGHEVPPAGERSLGRLQWEATALRVLSRKRVREGVVAAGESPLADAIAACAVGSLSGDAQSASSTVGVRALQHARREAFPAGAVGVAAMRELLSVVEVVLRLSIAGAEGAVLQRSVAQLRFLVNDLRREGIVQFLPGHFPAVFVLQDLSSLSVVLQRWRRLARETKRAALDAAIAICRQVGGAAAAACAAALAAKRADDAIDNADTAALRAHVQATAQSIPCDFPEECGEVLGGAMPGHGAPTGRFRYELGEAVEAAPPPAAPTRAASTATEDLSVGELVQQQQQPAPRRHASRATAASRPTATAATGAASAAAPAIVAVGVVGSRHPLCSSTFHDRFADAAKHASRECRYCGTCHLMEVLFNSCKTDCLWKHWPTERKIKLHLRRFPRVQRIAVERLQRMNRGEILETYNVDGLS